MNSTPQKHGMVPDFETPSFLNGQTQKPQDKIQKSQPSCGYDSQYIADNGFQSSTPARIPIENEQTCL